MMSTFPLIFQNIGCLIRGGAGRPKNCNMEKHGNCRSIPEQAMSNGCFLFLRCLLPTTENNGEAQKGCLCSQYTRLFVLSVWVWFKMISHKKWKSTMIHHICDGQEMVYGSHDFGPSLSLTYPGACMEGQSVCTYSQNGFICVCVELCCKVTPFDANRSYDGSRCNCRFGKE